MKTHFAFLAIVAGWVLSAAPGPASAASLEAIRFVNKKWVGPAPERVVDPTAPSPTDCPNRLKDHVLESDISKFLAGFPTIRIGVTESPNYGHQISSLVVARRLRQLGFRGKLEIIYEQYQQEKLAVLVHGFAAKGPEIQFVPEMNADFISYAAFARDADRFGQIALGIFGAEDSGGQMFRPSKPDRLRVDMLIRLQPADWQDGRQTLATTWGHEESLEDLKPLQHLVDPPADISAIKHHLAEGNRRQFIERILDTSGKNFEVGVVYNSQSDRLGTIYRYVQGLAFLFDHFPDFAIGGAVVPVLSDLSDFNLVNLKKMIAADANLASRVEIFSADDEALLSGSLPVPKGKIRIIKMDRLPPEVFAMILNRATLPAAIGGKYTRNQLLRMGKPFMDLFSDFFENLGVPGPEKDLLKTTYFDLSTGAPGDDDPFHVNGSGVAHYIVAVRSQFGDEYRRAFQRASVVADPVAEDKVAQALLRARAAFASRPK